MLPLLFGIPEASPFLCQLSLPIIIKSLLINHILLQKSIDPLLTVPWIMLRRLHYKGHAQDSTRIPLLARNIVAVLLLRPHLVKHPLTQYRLQ